MCEPRELRAVWFEPRWRAVSPTLTEAVRALAADVQDLERQARTRVRRRRPTDAAAFALEVERVLCNVATMRLARCEAGAFSLAGSRQARGGSQTRARLLAALCAGGWLRQVMTGAILAGGELEPSRWQPLPRLLAYLPERVRLADLQLVREPRPFMTITGPRGFLPLPPEALAMDADMRIINDWLRSLPISVDRADAEAWLDEPLPGHVRAPGEPAPPHRIVTAQHVELVRAFRGSLAEGGRMYLEGFWIGRAKEWRARFLRLAGEPIAEADYKATNLRLAYHHCGIAWPFADADPYIAGPGYRDGWKTVTNAMLWSAHTLGNWPGNERERRETRSHFPPGTTFPSVRAAVYRHHPGLTRAGVFGAGLAGRFERTESDVAVTLLLACRARGLPALPVHDCLLVPRSRAAEAALLMQQVAREVAGVDMPVTVQHGQ